MKKALSIKDIYFEIEYNGKTAKLPIADTPKNRKMYGIPLKKLSKKKSKKDSIRKGAIERVRRQVSPEQF